MRPGWRLVEWLLGRYLPPSELEPVMGDLVHDHAERRRRRGRLDADLWLLRESASLAAAYRARARATSSPRRPVMDRLRSDLLHARRAIRHRPAASFATVAVLTVGIGLVSAMFALADPYLLRPLPYARPHELIATRVSTRSRDSAPALADWQARQDLFAGLAAWGTLETAAIVAPRMETSIRVAPVTANFLGVLGVPAALPGDWRRAGSLAEVPIVLTAASRRDLFGADDAVGHLLRALQPGAPPYRVVGVLPESFLFPADRLSRAIGGLIPLADDSVARIYGIARLAPGVTPERVENALSTAARSPEGQATVTPREGVRVTADSLPSLLTRQVSPLALGALAAGILILLVSAANISNLLLTRGAYRTREFAAREALGATRLDIARLVLVELAVLTALGILGGLVLARGALTLAALVIPVDYISLGTPDITTRVIAFASSAGALVMLAGLVPAWAAWQITPVALFTQTSARESRTVWALRVSMTAAQAAIAVVLLVGAALLGRSYLTLLTQDPGYDANTLAIGVHYPRDSSGDRLVADIGATIERVRRLAGIERAGASPGALVGDTGGGGALPSIQINGRAVFALYRYVSVGFFDATASRVVDGRLPAADDAGRVVVVSESLARKCCPDRSPAGLNVTLRGRPYEVTGVIKDVFTSALDAPPPPTVFLPLDPLHTENNVTYFLRATAVNRALLESVQGAIRGVNPRADVAVSNTMRERLMRSVNDRSFATLILTFFTVAAVGVAAAGLVGVVGFIVARRTREIAIRLAIGASAAHVRRLVVSEAVTAAAIGSTVGLVAGAWMSKTMQSLLYGIAPADPPSLVAAAGTMFALVAMAAWLPARRALRIAPVDALRAE